MNKLLSTSPSENPVDHVLKYTIIYMNLKKIPEDKFEKIKTDENLEAINRFLDPGGMFMYLFCVNDKGMPTYVTDPPS